MTAITIVGAHGKVALYLAERLSPDHDVQGIVRKESQFDDLRDRGVTPVLLDLESASTQDFERVFAGQDCVVFAAGAGGGDTSRTYAIDRDASKRAADAALSAGVSRYLLISTIASGHPDFAPDESDYLIAKGEADEHLMGLGDLNWTILRPGWLSNDDPTGRISLGDGPDDTEGKEIPRADVAHVLAALVETGAASQRVVTVFGGDRGIDEAIGDLA